MQEQAGGPTSTTAARGGMGGTWDKGSVFLVSNSPTDQPSITQVALPPPPLLFREQGGGMKRIEQQQQLERGEASREPCGFLKGRQVGQLRSRERGTSPLYYLSIHNKLLSSPASFMPSATWFTFFSLPLVLIYLVMFLFIMNTDVFKFLICTSVFAVHCYNTELFHWEQLRMLVLIPVWGHGVEPHYDMLFLCT